MATWESGRETGLLDDILAGRKTIERRLKKGKFAEYRPGDYVSLRRDFRDKQGALRDGPTRAATVRVVAVRNYKSFFEMVEAEGFKHVIPSAVSSSEAADEYNKYYSADDQAKYGVLAIEIRPVDLVR